MPRNKYPEQTVEKILDAAALLFLQKGYQNTTLQDIIDATKLSKGAVYHHFRSKEEIAQRVGDRLGDQMLLPTSVWLPVRMTDAKSSAKFTPSKYEWPNCVASSGVPS